MLAQAPEIRKSEIDKTTGILPFKIGSNYIVSSKHIFLCDVSLSNLETEILNLERLYEKLNLSLSLIKDEFFLSHNLKNKYEHLQPIISEIVHKLRNLKPSQNSRRKRGLINAGGSVAKFLFGTLDATDGENYDRAIQILKSNKERVVTTVNSQISLSKQLVEKFSSSIAIIISNQKQIAQYVNKYKFTLNTLTSFTDTWPISACLTKSI